MAINVTNVRDDTPAARDLVFLDNAGSALSPKTVTETVIAYLQREQEVGGYAAMEESEDRLLAVRASAGRLVGVDAENIALQTSATAAWMRAFMSIPLGTGDRILTTRAEYASNVLPMLQSARRIGARVEFIPDGPDGTADPKALANMLDEHVKVVAVTHAASQNGLVVDATGIGAVIADSGTSPWYLLDACQSLGQLPVSMSATRADFIAGTGRKFLRGPRGTGLLAVSPRALAELEAVPLDMFGTHWNGGLDYQMSPTADRFQSFEMSYASLLGLGAAIDYALAIGLLEIRERLAALSEYLRGKLTQIGGVRVHDRGAEQSAIVVFSCPLADSWEAVRSLRARGVIVTAVTPATNPPDVDAYGATCVLRASPHIYNTEDDLDQLVGAVGDLIGVR